MDILSLSDLVKLVCAVTFGVVSVYVMMRYLEKEKSASSDLDKRLDQIKVIRREILNLQNSVANQPEELQRYMSEVRQQIGELRVRQAGISVSQRQDLVKKVSENITSEAAKIFFEKIKKEAAEEERARTKFTLVEEQFQPTINRLKDELFSLSKRGNLNLSIGIMITVIGLVLLGVFVLSFSNSQDDMVNFFMDFFPKISLVLLIEVFAYFFLSLYKSSLSEIKYFQNEITSMESKYLALKVALESAEKENINYVVEQLVKSERNFILEKGQSTVDLERAKNDQAAASDILGKAASIFGKKP